MRTVKVCLGGREYTINQLPMRAEAEWRRQLQAQLEPLLALVRGYESITFNTPAEMAAFVEGLAPLLLNAPDTMLALLYQYSPELALRADEVEAACYADEVVEALKGVLVLAYPFASELAALARNGQRLMGTGVQPPPLQTT